MEILSSISDQIAMKRGFFVDIIGVKSMAKLRSIFFPALLSILIKAACWADPPVVSINPPGPLNSGLENLQFTATAQDVDGDALTFQWSFQTLPPSLGGNAPQITVFPGNNTSTASFRITSEGPYVLQVIVDDLDGNSNTLSSALVEINAIFQQTFFVSNSGDDSIAIDEISLNSPLKTPGRALELAGPGDTILLITDSVQSPTLSTFTISTQQIPVAGTAADRLIFAGQTKGLIDIRPAGVNTGLRVIDKDFITFRNLNFHGFSNTALSITSSTEIIIEGCEFHDSGIGVSINSSTRTSVENSIFKGNKTGVQLQDSSNNRFALNVFTKNSEFGYRQIFIEPNKPSRNNTIEFSTFYDNGTVFDDDNFQGAIDLGKNSSNRVEGNLFVDNTKDFTAQHFFQTSINRNISFANLGLEADARFLPPASSVFFPITDPFLADPEGGDFRLLQGSIALGAGKGGANIGAYQGQNALFPTTKTIYVDFDRASTSFVQTGQSGSPYSSINKALKEADPGDRILVTASEQTPYTINFENRERWVPGWGTVTITGVTKKIGDFLLYPSLQCFSDDGDTLFIEDQRFLTLENFHITGIKDGSPDQCSRGIHLLRSRHIEFNNLVIHGNATAGITIDSSGGTFLSSSVIHDNTLAISMKGSHFKNQSTLFDKLTVASNLSGVSIGGSHQISFTNSIFANNGGSPCLSSDPNSEPTSLEIRFSLCRQPGVVHSSFQVPGNLNLTGSSDSVDPRFRSEDTLVQETNPHEAFLLVKTNAVISPALNSGDPDYPTQVVLAEFPSPLQTVLPANDTKTSTGQIDMGAFEQSLTDVDGDNLNNELEIQVGLDPNNPMDAVLDPDLDGLNNLEELSIYGTSITTDDTDGDGFSDGVEVAIGSNPLVDDADTIRALIPKPLILPHSTTLSPTVFTLDGIDRNGRAVQNLWTLINGPSSEDDTFLENTNRTLKVLGIQAGSYEIGLDQKLIASSGSNLTLKSLPEDRDITTITIQDIPPVPVLPPSIAATYAPGRIIYFYGSPTITENPSYDPNGNQIFSYEWILERPINPQPGLIDFNSPTPFLTLPNRTEVYEFRLKVTSSGPAGVQQGISSDTYRISVVSSNTALPRADAGPDGRTFVQTLTTLLGLGSGDAQGSSLFYAWRQRSGPEVQFLAPTNCPLNLFEPGAISVLTTPCATGSTPQFLADQPGAVVFELVVSKDGPEGTLTSLPDTVTLIVDSPSNAVPEARILEVSSPKLFQQLTLDGTPSFDRKSLEGTQSTALQYQWKQVSGPPVFLETTTQSRLSFTPIQASPYQFELTVLDGQGVASVPALIDIPIASDQTPLPIARAGEDQTSLVNRFVVLNGSDSSGDAGSVLQYFWEQVKGPEQIQASGISSPLLSFQPKLSGVYTFALRVFDGVQLSLPDEVSVAVNSDIDFVPVALAGTNQTAAPGSIVTLDGRGSFDMDNDPLFFIWEQVAGTPVILSAPNSSVTTFQTFVSGLYQFALYVSDGKSLSPANFTLVSISPGPIATGPPGSSGFDPTTILDPDSQGGTCFIISASFGPHSFPVRFFQGFRDQVLQKLPGGRTLMEIYYRYSPPLAFYIQNSILLKLMIQLLLVSLIVFMVGSPLVFIAVGYRKFKETWYE